MTVVEDMPVPLTCVRANADVHRRTDWRIAGGTWPDVPKPGAPHCGLCHPPALPGEYLDTRTAEFAAELEARDAAP